MQPMDEIERLRTEMLVGSKQGNRFLEGFSKSAIVLHSVALESLWIRLIEDDQKIKIRPGVPATIQIQEPEVDDEQGNHGESTTDMQGAQVQATNEDTEFTDLEEPSP